jgi:hypothetical protein
MLLSLVGVAVVAPFFAVALVVGARAVALAASTGDDWLMMALAFGGAIASVVNGLGRRTAHAERDGQAAAETRRRAEAIDASVIGLGC